MAGVFGVPASKAVGPLPSGGGPGPCSSRCRPASVAPVATPSRRVATKPDAGRAVQRLVAARDDARRRRRPAAGSRPSGRRRAIGCRRRVRAAARADARDVEHFAPVTLLACVQHHERPAAVVAIERQSSSSADATTSHGQISLGPAAPSAHANDRAVLPAGRQHAIAAARACARSARLRPSVAPDTNATCSVRGAAHGRETRRAFGARTVSAASRVRGPSPRSALTPTSLEPVAHGEIQHGSAAFGSALVAFGVVEVDHEMPSQRS